MMRLLLVEDNPDTGFSLLSLLELIGKKVELVTCHNGAKKLLDEGNFYHVGIVDWILCGETGLKTLRLLHEAGTPKLLLMTAAPPEMIPQETQDEIRRMGVIWVSKPFELDDLLAALGLSRHEIPAITSGAK